MASISRTPVIDPQSFLALLADLRQLEHSQETAAHHLSLAVASLDDLAQLAPALDGLTNELLHTRAALRLLKARLLAAGEPE